MSKVIKLKKGLDIKLNGEAEKVVQPAGKITSCALKPTDFRAMTPKLAVKVGDEVKAGDVLFIDKTHPEIKFTTPVSGTIEAINRGERRKLLEVVVKADAETRYRDFGKTEVSKLNRDEIIDRLLESGVWPLIKQRPYDIIANDLAKAEEGKDYVVLSVVAPTFNGEKSEADFKNWYQSLDYKDFPVLLDSKGELLKEYGIRSYPSALFIASDGTLAKTHIGYMSKEDIVQTLKEMK